MACFCTGGKNTGKNGSPFQKQVNGFFVNIFANDGTRNKILNTDTIDQTFIDAKINEADPSKRWYPIGEFKNLTDTRDAPQAESFNDGSSANTTKSPRLFEGLLLNMPERALSKYEAFACEKFGVYAIDDCGSLQGEQNSDCTELYPSEISAPSYNARLVKPTDSEVQKIMLMWQYSQLIKDSNLNHIDSADITADLVNIDGLLDVNSVITAPTPTGFVATQTYIYGTFGNKSLFVGGLIGDYTLFNNTTVLPIVITSVTESPDGTYTFVIPAQTAADSLTLSGSKTGFDFADVTFTV